MRILIDMQGAQSSSRFRGIGRYSLALSLAIAKGYHDKHEILLLLNGMFPETIDTIRNIFHGVLPKSHIKIWQGCQPAHYSDKSNDKRIASASLLRETYIMNLNPNILLILSTIEGYHDNSIITSHAKYPIPYSVIFYDAIPYMQADKYINPLGKRFEKYYYEKIDIIKKASVVFGISNSSCKEAEEILNIDKEKIVNISSAADDIFQPYTYTIEEQRNIKNHFDIKDKFILYSGATDERKNHIRLIKAYALLSDTLKEKYQLVIAGGMPLENRINFQKTMSKCGLDKDDILFTGKVSDKELIALYNLCDLYIFPSYHEGFGLPALEAMQCGAPTIGANTTSVPEVIGREDALFDPFSVEAIASKITEVLHSESLRVSLKKHALLQAKTFSWQKSAVNVINGLETWHKTSKASVPSNKETDTLIENLIENLIEDISGINPEPSDLYNISQAIAYNLNAEKKQQLLVDISELVQTDAKSGIQRVVRSILKELLLSPPKNYTVRAVYATNDKQGYQYADTFTNVFLGKNNNDFIVDYPVDLHANDIFLALDMSPSIQTFQKPYYQKLRKLGIEIHFVIYDILLIKHPQWWPQGAKENFEKLLETIITVSDNITCISSSVASDVQKYINDNYTNMLRKPSVDYFHLGADIQNSVPSKGLDASSDTVLKSIRKFSSFLMVGTLEPRKGHLQTLLAFEQLWKENVDANLVVVGKEGWLVEDLVNKLKHHPQLSKKLFWLQGISDEYLEKVYEDCACLLAPSEGEGFGLPLIEAAQKKKPILARDIPIFKEVAGNYAFYFENNSKPSMLAHSIKKWLGLYKNNKHPTSDAMPWLTWKESAEQLKKCLNLNKIL